MRSAASTALGPDSGKTEALYVDIPSTIMSAMPSAYPSAAAFPLAFPNGCDDATAGQGRAHGGAASHGKAAGDGEERSAPGEAGESSEDRERDRPCGGCPGAYLLGRGVHGGSVPAGTDSTGTGWPAGLGS